MNAFVKRLLTVLLAVSLLCLGVLPAAADDPEFEKDWLKYADLTADYTKNDDGTWSVNAWNWYGQRLYKKPVGQDVTIEMAVSKVQEGAWWGLIVRADKLEGQSTTVEKMNACVGRVIRSGSEFDSSLYLYGRKADGTSMATSKPVDSDLSKEHVMRLTAKGDKLTVYYDDMAKPVITFEDNKWEGEYVGIYHALNIGAIIHYVKINDEVVLGKYDGIVEKLNPTTAPAPTTEATAAPTTAAEPSETAGQTTASTRSDIFADTSAQSEPETEPSGLPLWAMIAIPAAVVAAGGAAAVILLRKKKKQA